MSVHGELHSIYIWYFVVVVHTAHGIIYDVLVTFFGYDVRYTFPSIFVLPL